VLASSISRAGGGRRAVGRKLSLVTVDMMVAFFERCFPCWGHHGEALRSRCDGLTG
jgi:hypothetical protein